jgi:CubicO group peptidase (beta-lactamase class C family)
VRSRALALLGLCACGQRDLGAPPSDRTESARHRLSELVAGGRTPGLQYLVLDSTRIVFAYDDGWADLANRRRMDTATTLMAYSMSKTITAAAVLQLVQAGAIGLDDPVNRYLAEVPYETGVTIRTLLAHTAGLPNPLPLRWVHAANRHADFDEGAALAAVLAAHPSLRDPPGTRYRYSNIGYWLLGRVVERVSGRPFPAYVTEHVLRPLGLGPHDLGYVIADPARHAHGYLERYSWLNLIKGWLIDPDLVGGYEGRWLRIRDHYPNGPAFGGLIGTARGFGRFLQDQLRAHSALFDDATRSLFYTQQQTSDGRPVAMTLGWHVGTLGGMRFYYKEGGGGGFHCEMRLYPQAGRATIVMTNATAIDVTRALNRIDPAFLSP